MTKIVILGLGAAGFAAALAIKKTDREAEVVFIDKKDYDLMHPCGLPFAIEGKVKLDDLKHSINADKMGIKVLSESSVESIDLNSKKVNFSKNNEKKEENYDKLIIALGSSPFIPDIEGKENCFVVSDIESIKKIIEKTKTAKNACVIGAGAIGLETAYALSNKGLNVTIVEMLSSLLPKAIDEDISNVLKENLEKNNIKVLLSKKLTKITENSAILDDGQEVPSELTIMAAGVKGNYEIAEKAGLEVGKFGIKVNEKMETNVKDIYVVGDCIETKSLINQEPYVAWIASSAYKQGTVAGVNAAGGNASYNGTLTPFASVIGELEIGATGFNSHFAEKYGYEIVVGKAKSKTKPDWFPGGEEIIVKIIVDKKTRKILGGQAVGKNAADKIDLITMAISKGATIDDLSNLELSYCPAVSQTYGVITQAADLALRKIK